jgi:hypothetical protein
MIRHHDVVACSPFDGDLPESMFRTEVFVAGRHLSEDGSQYVVTIFQHLFLWKKNSPKSTRQP